MDTNTLTKSEYEFLSRALALYSKTEEYFITSHMEGETKERELNKLREQLRNISLWIYNNHK